MILSLIWETKKASGYQINAMINNRGFREWADIGMTSIYNTLKKLEQKDLISSHITTDKTTQGPAAKEYSLTEKGRLLLIEETKKGLSETRERDRRFDLGLSMIDILPRITALGLIEKRKLYLRSEQKRLSEIYTGQQQSISFSGALLFRHTLQFIQSEISFLVEIINKWEEVDREN
jgi:DNA-binding PadR family transcriptional regulator